MFGSEKKTGKHAIARRLTEKYRGLVKVSHEARMFMEGDPSGKGRMYLALVIAEEEQDMVNLDDRLPQSLDQQLEDELIRVADFYLNLAAEVADVRKRAKVKA